MKKRNLGIILSYTNTILNMVTGLFLSSFLLRQLGDIEYGVYQTVSSFATYLVLLEFGTGTVMARNLSVCRSKCESEKVINKNISTIWSITNILALLITAVSIAFYFSFEYIYSNSLTPDQLIIGKQIFIFITIYLLASFYAQTINGIMLAFEDYTYSSILSIIRIITRTILLVVILLNIKKAIMISIVDASLGIMISLFGYIYATKKIKVKIDFKGFDFLILKSSLPLCLAIFLQAIVNQTNSNVGKFVLGISVGPEKVALYSVGLYIYSILSSVSTIPLTLYVPQVTKDVTLGMRGKELTESLIQPSRLIVIVGGTIMFGFFAAGKPFISIVYGDKYMLAWTIALILMIPMFINMTMGIIINVLDAMNKRLARSLILMISTCLNILLTIILIRYMDIIGAAIATGGCILLQIVMLCVYYSQSIKIKVFYLLKKAYEGILVYQIIGATIGFLAGKSVSNVYGAFLVSGAVYVAIAFGGFLLLGKNETENVAIVKLLQRIKKK